MTKKDDSAELAADVNDTTVVHASGRQAAIQELYDATTLLQATMAFIDDAEGLLGPELNYAERRLMAARSRLRHLGVIAHQDAGLLAMPPVPPPFDREPDAVQRQRARCKSS